MGSEGRLTAIRRAQRGQMTKIFGKTEEKLAEILLVDESSRTLETVQPFSTLIDALFTKFEYLRQLDQQLMDEIVDETELTNTIVESDDYLTEIQIKLGRFKLNLDNLLAKIPKPQSLNESVSTINRSSTTSTGSKKVNLPKLALPNFDGDILKWSTFYDNFISAVDSDPHLDDIQKFQYLVAQLTDEAARTIEGLQITSANYKEALTILVERYGQPHKIVNAYIRALLDLQPPQDHESLREFYDSLETYIRGLRALGKSEDAFGDILVPVVFDKLPSPVRTQISREHGDRAWTLKELRDAIRKEIQATQAGASCVNFDNEKLSALHISTKTRKNPASKNNSCAFCKGPHTAFSCDIIVNPKKRQDIIKANRKCYNCFGNHMVTACQSKYRCKVCKGKHHTAIHIDRNTDTHIESKNIHVNIAPTSSPVLLKSAIGQINYGSNSTTVNILFDEGAQCSFITKKSVNELGVRLDKFEKQDVNISTFGDNSPGARTLRSIDLKLRTRKGEIGLRALVVPEICPPIQNNVKLAVTNHPYLRNLPLAPYVNTSNYEINLLIGADYYWSIVENEVVRGAGPTAVSSKLGFLLSGPINLNANTSVLHTTCLLNTIHSNDEFSKLSNYWDLEVIGIKETIKSETMNFETYRDNYLKRDTSGKYIANLPWKEDYPPLPTNFDICTARTRSMVKRLSPELRQKYNAIIAEQLSREFIEIVENDDKSQGHYIPHHSVKKESITTPIRIVYDCSCKQGDNPSLNDCLESGPSLINDLVQILIRFRTNNVAFTSDIEKAFLNVKLGENDRNFTKFLWLSDPTDPDSPFKVYRFKSVLFGSTSSPFILNSVVKTHLQSENTEISIDMQSNIYVDNVLSGSHNAKKAIEYFEEATNTMSRGGFILRSWATNDPELRSLIKQQAMVFKGHKRPSYVHSVCGI
ncbi:uncharacterized protein LOC141904356 [Tubulanus polymorphus]|uniref:uncharacterized protein LOC141904356 n=1 Tax=Tubulanus polymorphus TaxID=672921 RepID=UPI003DA235BD